MARQQSPTLSVEALEERSLVAANPVTVVANDGIGSWALHAASGQTLTQVQVRDSGTLVIEGTGYGDRVQVKEVTQNLTKVLRVWNTILDDKGNTLKREVFDVNPQSLGYADAKIVFLGKAGHDYFQFFPQQGAKDFRILAWGGDGNDVLWGSNRDDLLVAGGGEKNFLKGEWGNDILIGGDGRDELRGGPGDDILLGGMGKDVLHGDLGGNETPAYRDARMDGNDILDGGKDGVGDLITMGGGADLYVIDPMGVAGFIGSGNRDYPTDLKNSASYSVWDRPISCSVADAVAAAFADSSLSDGQRANLVNNLIQEREYPYIGHFVSGMYRFFQGEYYNVVFGTKAGN